jgi:hypothetical protein
VVVGINALHVYFRQESGFSPKLEKGYWFRLDQVGIDAITLHNYSRFMVGLDKFKS